MFDSIVNNYGQVFANIYERAFEKKYFTQCSVRSDSLSPLSPSYTTVINPLTVSAGLPAAFVEGRGDLGQSVCKECHHDVCVYIVCNVFAINT